MSDFEDLIVLSDLHVSAERGRGLFRLDAELATFLRWIAEDTRRTRVVLAGDVLDYLVAADGEVGVESFDPCAALARTRVMMDRHDEVFDALEQLAASPHHELWIMSGNHDPELLFTDVREIIDRRLGGRAAAQALRWSVDGEALRFRIGDAAVLVTHGDTFDDWNRIDHALLRRDANRLSYGFTDAREHDYEPPAGTHIVLEYVTRLRAMYPWVDTLKPEREAVFCLLSAFLTGRELWSYKGFLARALRNRTESWIRKWIRRHHPEKLVRAAPSGVSRLERFEQWLNSNDDGDTKLIARLRSVSAEDTYFDVAVPDESSELLPYFFERGADLLVAGHTHAAKAHLVGDQHLYLNTGTWGHLLQLPAGDAAEETWSSFLASLRSGEDLSFARPTFAHIRNVPGGIASASLLAWEAGGATPQVTYSFDIPSRAWKETSP
jgi:UDP-2,3-diacylglucosamine pyrophosphatase LpxH